MRARCELKVDRLAERDCSSPMSASTVEKAGSAAGGSHGTGSPARAMHTASPSAFITAVFPPVLGPVRWWCVGRGEEVVAVCVCGSQVCRHIDVGALVQSVLAEMGWVGGEVVAQAAGRCVCRAQAGTHVSPRHL